jgi:hypothetical protein
MAKKQIIFCRGKEKKTLKAKYLVIIIIVVVVTIENF